MTNNFQENQAKNQAQINQEAKTVVNGKVVPVSQALQAEQQAAQQAQQTGVQAHHDNNTEAVQAGQMASSAQPIEDETLRIKQVNVQSGQAQNQLNQAQQAMTEQEKIQQEIQKDAQQAQQEAKAKAAAKTTKKAD